jgi:YD repeat-containing protein
MVVSRLFLFALLLAGAAFGRVECWHVDDASVGATRTTDYTYNANGSLATLTQPNGVVHSYGYDTLNRLRSLGVTRGATTIHGYD